MRVAVDVKKTATTVTTNVAEINRMQLILMLRSQGHPVPDDADIYVRIPGGGDWSNTNLDIDADSNLFVTWKTTETSGD